MNSTTITGVILIVIGSAFTIYGPTRDTRNSKVFITFLGLVVTGLGTYFTILGPSKDSDKEISDLKSQLEFQRDHFLNEKRSTSENSYHITDKFGDAQIDNETKISYIKTESAILSLYKKQYNLTDFNTKVNMGLEDLPFILDAVGHDEDQVGPDCINYYFFSVYNSDTTLSKNSKILIRSFDTFFDNYRQRLNPTHQQHKAILLLICKNKFGIEEQLLEMFDQYNRSPIFETKLYDLSEIKF